MQRSLILMTALFVTPSPAAAQGTVGSASGLSSSIFKLMNGVGTTPAAPGKTATPPKPAPGASASTLNFKVSPTVRQKVIQAFVQEMSGLSAEAGAEWKKVFTATDVFAAVEGEVKTRFGLSSTNVADVWAVYWSYAWLMTRGRTDDPTRAQVVGLRNQFRPLLLSLPEVAGLNDARKQEMAESLLLQTVMFGALAEAWKDDPGSRTEFGQGLQQGTASLGLDLGKVELTDQGFAVRK